MTFLAGLTLTLQIWIAHMLCNQQDKAIDAIEDSSSKKMPTMPSHYVALIMLSF